MGLVLLRHGPVRARISRKVGGPPACVPPVVPQSSIATPFCPAGPPTMVLWPSCSNPAAAVDRCFFLAARRVLSFGAPRDASVNSPNISRNTASMRTRSPVASSQVAARASRPTRAWRDCPHTRVETRRRQTCSNGGDQIAYEPLQESGELFGVLKCKPVDSEGESPEFPILGEDQVSTHTTAVSGVCRTPTSLAQSRGVVAHGFRLTLRISIAPWSQKNRATFGALVSTPAANGHNDSPARPLLRM